jgi:hypothetical protein
MIDIPTPHLHAAAPQDPDQGRRIGVAADPGLFQQPERPFALFVEIHTDSIVENVF